MPQVTDPAVLCWLFRAVEGRLDGMPVSGLTQAGPAVYYIILYYIILYYIILYMPSLFFNDDDDDDDDDKETSA